MIDFYSTWLLLGTVYLFILTVQDYKSMSVDSKYNYILLGLAIGLIAPSGVSFWYLCCLTAGMIFIDWYGSKINFFGRGDFSAFRWLFLGLGVINVFYLAFYIVVLVLLGCFYYFARFIIMHYGFKRYGSSIRFYRKVVFSTPKPVPFYPVIAGAWVITLLLFM